MCDVDENRAAEGFNAVPDALRYNDFRKMFDEMGNQIDAVLVSTPDHTHFPAAMAAMQLGKHVYVEKPLAHNIWKLRTLRKAARHYNVITQMGNQGHATDGIRRVKEWYDWKRNFHRVLPRAFCPISPSFVLNFLYGETNRP